MNEPVIQLEGLGKSFGHNVVLRQVDLAISRGTVVGLMGTNGSGKSTLIKCLLGLLRRSAGSSRVFGDDSWSLSAATKGRLGYVPQDVRLYPWMTAPQVIDYTAAFYPALGPHPDKRPGPPLACARRSADRAIFARRVAKVGPDPRAGASAGTARAGRTGRCPRPRCAA